MESNLSLLVVLLGVSTAVCLSDATSTPLVNQKLIRSVNLADNHANVKMIVEVRNDADTAVHHYDIVLDRQHMQRLADAWISPVSSSSPVLFKLYSKRDDGSSLLRANVTIGSGDSVKFKVELSFVHLVEPSPRKMKQMERLFVIIRDNDVWFSPYKTEWQKTKYRLGTADVSYFSPHGTLEKKTVSYGPVTDAEAFSSGEPVMVRFFHDKALATATKLVKEIEISHWGNVAVEEHYEMKNSGSELDGPFCRVDYDSAAPTAKAGAFHWLHANFPTAASDMYIRDEIGNVSTSHVRQERHQVHAEIASRFPLYGGWSTDFYLGYNLPSDHVLYTEPRSGRFVLQMDFGTPFEDIVVDEYVVRVITPEGASDVQWVAPLMDVAEGASGLRFTYMDIIGRPMLELTKPNVVSRLHNKPFQVSYTMPSYHLLREPLMLFLGFFAFLLVCAAYVRLDLSISSPAAPRHTLSGKDTQTMALNAVGKTSDTFDKLVRLCIDRHKDAKSVHTTLQQQVKVLAHDFPDAVAAIKSNVELMWKLRSKPTDSKFTAQVSKVEKLFKALLDEQ